MEVSSLIYLTSPGLSLKNLLYHLHISISLSSKSYCSKRGRGSFQCKTPAWRLVLHNSFNMLARKSVEIPGKEHTPSPHFCFVFMRQSLVLYPKLVLNSESLLLFPGDGTREVYHCKVCSTKI